MAEREYLTPAELKSNGYLQEVNRQFFHPLGLALAVDPDQDLGPDGAFIVAVWDSRSDPEGWFFAEEEVNDTNALALAGQVANEVGAKAAQRIAVAGAVVQPIPSTLRVWRAVEAPGPTGEVGTIRSMWGATCATPPPGVEVVVTKCTWELGDDGVWERTVTSWEHPPLVDEVEGDGGEG